MNKITATVKSIQETDVVTYIQVTSGDTDITLIKSKTPQWLSVGDEVYCTFQEATVSVGKDCPGKLSIENCLPGVLTCVRKNESLCELTFDSDIGKIVSLITSGAYETLNLEEGCPATILLRALDIQLEPLLAPIDMEKYNKAISRIKHAN